MKLKIVLSVLVKRSFFILACALSGCSLVSQQESPMSTSLGELIAETNRTETKVATYQEIVSIAGNLPIPEVGPIHVYPEIGLWALPSRKKLSPAHLIGISDSTAEHSFYLLGTSAPSSEYPDSQVLKKITTKLGQIQDSIAESIRLSLALASIDVKSGLPDISPTQLNTLSSDRLALRNKIESNDAAVEKLQNELRELASTPGILIARWNAASDVVGDADAGQLLGGSSKQHRGQSGYLVMNGYRVALLFFGRDFEYYVRCMRDEDFDAFKNAAIASYVLQTKEVAYTSSLDIQSILSIYAEIDPKNAKANLQAIDRLAIAGYAAKLASFSNMGMFTNLQWQKEPLNFSAFAENPGKDIVFRPIGNDFDRYQAKSVLVRLRPDPIFADETALKPHLDGWHTVQAIMTTAPDFFKSLKKRGCEIDNSGH